MSIEQTKKTIFLQARRASKLLDVSLSDAKKFISQAIYQCHDYQDLIHKVQNKKLKPTVYPYSQITPRTINGSVEYLIEKIDEIAVRCAKFLAKPHNEYQVRRLVFSILNVAENTVNGELMDNKKIEPWYRVSYGEGDVSGAIMMCECIVNDVPFKLYFNKIVAAESFEHFGKKTSRFLNEQVFSEFAIPPIFWQSESRWSNALEKAVTCFHQNRYIEMTDVFECELTKNPAQRAYQLRLGNFLSSLQNELLTESLKPIEYENGQYQLVGYPIRESDCTGNIDRLPWFEYSQADLQLDRAFGYIEGQAICFQFIPVDTNGQIIGELKDVHSEIVEQILEFECADKSFVEIEGNEYFAIARCVTEAEYMRLQMSHLRLAKYPDFELRKIQVSGSQAERAEKSA